MSIRPNGDVIAQLHGFLSTRRDRRTQIRFVGRFVFGESDITVDPHDTLFCRQVFQMIGRSEFIDKVVNEALKGSTSVFIGVSILVEPSLIVVLTQFAKEIKRRAKVKYCRHGLLSFYNYCSNFTI